MGHHPSKHNGRHTASDSRTSPKLTGGVSTRRLEPGSQVQRHDLSNFAAITVIFNPVKYQSRYDHYQKFEAHMSHCGVYLVTVECIFESTPHFGLPRQNFEVTRAGDRRHIQLVAPSIIWMKENLINIAVKRLPSNIEYIAWLDADIEFERLDWAYLAIEELKRFPIVQLFELSYFLGPGGKKDILRRDYSFGYSIRHNKPIAPQNNEWYAHPGYAWAMRRSAFNTIGGLLDFCIIGSGDLHFAFALLNRINETIRPGLHRDYGELALIWGERMAQVADNGRNVGYVPTNLWHHWHGERSDRYYVDRWTILEKHQYSPLNDLEKNDDTGLLRLRDKAHFEHANMRTHIESLEREIVEYFKSRNEDSNVRTIQTRSSPAKAKPFIAPKTQPRRGGGTTKTTTFAPIKMRGSSKPHLWTSGHAGTHVDDDNPYLDQCTCHGHHHPDNHDCPCSPNHMDDQHCWDSSGNDHHHHHHDHHPETCLPSDDHHHRPHHHTNDDYGGHHSSHLSDHHHHQHSGSVHDSGHHTDHWSGGGGYDYQSAGGSGGYTDYSGHGSFY